MVRNTVQFAPAARGRTLIAIGAVVLVATVCLHSVRHPVGLVPETAAPAARANKAARPYFQGADWLWKPIADAPALAPNSARWVSYLADPRGKRVAELHNEGSTLIPAEAITDDTPRYDVHFTMPWGDDPFGAYRVPIPPNTTVSDVVGGDNRLTIQDPTTGQVFGLWQAKYDRARNTWSASWGGRAALYGNGVDAYGSATAAGLSRYAGIITAAELTAAAAAGTGLRHALVVASDIAGPTFVPPAIKSDGTNAAKAAVPIPEGSRIQLDPSVAVDALPGITAGERVIAKTLQTHGAYIIDRGGARMSFAFEYLPDSTDTFPGQAWVDAGLTWDYYDMTAIPWSKLRVLAP